MHLLDWSEPMIMGILNTTPDSFFDGGRYSHLDDALRRAERLISEGAHIIDVGGASSRPGATPVPEADERRRTEPVIAALHARFPETILSIDTWRGTVARAAVEAGARLVNDISGGEMDTSLYPTLAALHRQTPIYYVLMHMQGTPETMQHNPQYGDIVTEVMDFFIRKIQLLKDIGLYDVIIDPGFGFGKTVEDNYALLRRLSDFKTVLDMPLLAGLSRKSMICKVLGVPPADALNGTTALHMVALLQGANILRVHDVKEAAEVVKVWLSVVGSR